MTQNAIPTPVHADGLAVDERLPRQRPARGEARRGEGRPRRLAGRSPGGSTATRRYVPSPLALRRRLYVLKGNNGLLSAFDARTGERLYGPERLRGRPNVYASPSAPTGASTSPAATGATAVVQRGPAFKLLATNTLDDGFDASPVGGRTPSCTCAASRYLYRISE